MNYLSKEDFEDILEYRGYIEDISDNVRFFETTGKNGVIYAIAECFFCEFGELRDYSGLSALTIECLDNTQVKIIETYTNGKLTDSRIEYNDDEW